MFSLCLLATLFSYCRAEITKLESCVYTSSNGQCDAGEFCSDVCTVTPTSCDVGVSCDQLEQAYENAGMSVYGGCYSQTSAGMTVDMKITCEDGSSGGGSSGGGDEGNGNDTSTGGGGGGSDAGTIAGIVIGVLVGVALIAVIVYFVYKKKA